MKIARLRRARVIRTAFTLVEVMVASALIGIMVLAFMGGYSTSFQNIQLDRENSRAAQILLEKTELLRLYNWDQITGNDTNTYIPATFTAPFYPDTNNGGFVFSGTVTISAAPITETYSSDMRYITINLAWTSGGVQRSRSMISYVSRYGLQNYIY
jgi:prepilin-type N-terminal cleavage/methylation domain-containing protein